MIDMDVEPAKFGGGCSSSRKGHAPRYFGRMKRRMKKNESIRFLFLSARGERLNNTTDHRNHMITPVFWETITVVQPTDVRVAEKWNKLSRNFCALT